MDNQYNNTNHKKHTGKFTEINLTIRLVISVIINTVLKLLNHLCTDNVGPHSLQT